MTSVRAAQRHDESCYDWEHRVFQSAQARFAPLFGQIVRGLLARGRTVMGRDFYRTMGRWNDRQYCGETRLGIDGARFTIGWTLVQDKITKEPRDQIVIRFGTKVGDPGKRRNNGGPSRDCVRLIEPDGGFDARKVIEAIEAWLVETKKQIATKKSHEQRAKRQRDCQEKIKKHAENLDLLDVAVYVKENTVVVRASFVSDSPESALDQLDAIANAIAAEKANAAFQRARRKREAEEANAAATAPAALPVDPFAVPPTE